MHTTHLHEQFFNYFLNKRGLLNNLAILLSISGGQDSLSLLKLVSDFQPDYRWRVGLIYFDHRFRVDSCSNLLQILNICRNFRIESYIYQSLLKDSSEIKCREWRYNTIFHTTIINHYCKVITAHTLTDLSETFLQFILRGTSTDSFNSIISNTNQNYNISVLRPLQKFKRSETSWLSRKFCLPLWSDYTNYDCNKTRNRLREELIPYLQQYFQPQLFYKIQSFLKTTKMDIEYLQKITIKLYLLIKHPDFIAINYSLLLKQPRTLRYRIIKLFFKHNFNIMITKKMDNIINNIKEKKLTIKLSKNMNLKLIITNNWLYIIVI